MIWAALHSPITVTLQDLITLKLCLNGFNLNPGDLGLKQEAEAEILRLSAEREEACLSNTFAFVIIKAVE